MMQQHGEKDKNHSSGLSRRRFLMLGAFAGFSYLVPRSASGTRSVQVSGKRSLLFYNTHTQESLCVDYWINGKYSPDALSRINYIFRDHRNNKIQPLDTRLLDLIHSLGKRIETNQPFHIISGYRSPETNALLRKQGRGAAKQSYHMLGKAVDIRIPDCSLSNLRDTALKLERGGVGYYPRSDFIHIDTGPARSW